MLLVNHLRKDFGNVRAIHDVAFTIRDGATFGLLGPNGAGKTTTMRMILGIYTPDGGEITWNGARIDERTRRRFGYLPEERGLYGKMRVRDHILYFARLHGIRESDVARRTNEWIERLELQEYADRPCAELSKGNQQKVQVACAAVHHPELLVLDEPFSGLDPVNAEMLLGVFESLRAAGTTLVLSSHQMWQIERLCTEFCIVTHGRNRISGTLADLRADWPTRAVRIAPNSSAVHEVLDGVDGAKLISDGKGEATYELPPTTNGAELLRALVGVESIVAFEPLEPTLHDIYLRVIEEAA